MSYDAYGAGHQPLRAAMDRGYIDGSSDPRLPNPSYLDLRTRDSGVSAHAREPSTGKESYGRGDNFRSAYVSSLSTDEAEAQEVSSTPARAETSVPANNNVSPELIAEITERIKKEVVEHLKQTGSLEDHPRPTVAPPSTWDKTSETSSPTQGPPRVYTPPSPIVHNSKPSAPIEPMDYRYSPPGSFGDRSASVRFEDGKGLSDGFGASHTPRPSAAPRTYSTVELSTIDQKWGRLFENGEPTPRLGQFLRGLANHIIEEYPPKNSIVVTPEKMVAYYKDFPLDKEIHPFISIFKSTSNEHISRLYRDLSCQHHLVQETPTSPPKVPALTPVGFAKWMEIAILAYPDEESHRLEKVVLALPIDADGQMIDNRPERLPKQISRHLLPSTTNRFAKEHLDDAVADFLQDVGPKPRRRKESTTSPPISRRTSTASSKPRPINIIQSSTSNPIERERMPYSGTSVTSDTATNDTTSESSTSVPIERERQPYTAAPGTGRVYENLNVKSSDPSRSRERANSASRHRDSESSGHHRTQSNASYNPGPRPGGATRRAASPAFKSFSNSTPVNLSNDTYAPGPGLSNSSFVTGLPTSVSPFDFRERDREHEREILRERERGRDREDDARRYARERDPRRSVEEEARIFSNPRDGERYDKHERGSVVYDDDYYRGGIRGYDTGYQPKRY